MFLQAKPEREAFRQLIQAEIVITLCIDGRKRKAVFGLPVGYLWPLRNGGGEFHVGWEKVRATLNDLEKIARAGGLNPIVLITYHFSGSDKGLGCTWFKNNTSQAILSMERFMGEIQYAYSGSIHSFVVGINTDNGAILLHGESGMSLNVDGQAEDFKDRRPVDEIMTIFPSKSGKICLALAEIIQRNASYVATLISDGTTKVLGHDEEMICFGQGFGFMDKFNKAIIIGPCDPDYSHSLKTGLTIIQKNYSRKKKDRISEVSLILVSTPFYQPDHQRGAELETRMRATRVKGYIEHEFPNLEMEMMQGVLNLQNWELIPLI